VPVLAKNLGEEGTDHEENGFSFCPGLCVHHGNGGGDGCWPYGSGDGALRRRKLFTLREVIVTKRQELERKYAAAAELRIRKVDEIRELLAIPPHPGDEETVKFIARWRDTGEISVPAQLSTKAQRLLREWHSIHKACVEIQNEFEQSSAKARMKASPRRITAAK
jgi:hypothetical protein